MSISEKKISIPSPIKKIELPQKKYSKKQKLQKLIKSAQKQLNKKHFDRALDLAQQAFEYIQSNFPIKSKERVNSHLLLADIYFTQKKYSAAEIHYQQAFRINKEMLGERHEKSLNVLNQLAQLYHQWKNIQKAEEYYKKLNVIYQDIFGNNHRETLGIIKKLTELLMDSKQYDKARPYAAQALKISKRLYGNNAASTLDAMIQAGKIYYYCKAYVRAFNTFDQALSITQHDMNIPSLKKLDIYQFIGELHELQKRYQDAEDMFKKAIALTQQINGPENSHQLEIYQKLIQLYKHQDKYQEAKTSLIKTVQLSETLLGDKNSQTIRYQKDLANLMFKQKEYGHAAEILSKALESSKYVYGENHEKTFSLSRRLAEIFIAQARYQEAESLYRTNLKVQKKILNATRDNLEQLALLFKMQKNCAGAVELLDQAFRLNEATLGPTHAETLKSLMELIGCMVKSNQHIQALDKLKRIEKPLFKQQLELMQSHQYHENLQGKTHKKSVKLDSSTFCDAVLSLSRSMSDQDVIAYAADVMLRWQYLNHFPEPEQQSLPGHKDINALFKIQMQNLPYRLPRNSAFFHIVPYEHIDFFNTKTTDTRWFVMMILSEQETNHMICQDLGPIHHTRKLIRRLMNHKTEQSQKKQIEFKLFQQLFGIFEENIKNIQSIYISANGYANHIPYDRLRHDDHHFWIERQHICRVFSAMDFLNPISHVYTGSLLAIGQVDYDTFVDIKTGNVNEQTNHFTGANSHIPFPKNQNVNFRYKPHPEESHVIKEIINIYDLCRKSSPVFWSGTEANEFALKRLANPPRVIHFFVDCFYLNLNNDSALNEMSGGLALAGANKGFMKQTDPYGQDGLLLNPEILDLNLNETELVFLTKKCDGYTSESSFSPFFQMAAAFHMAGCRFVISPAWPVRHDTSSMFMIHFYENWLRQSISNPSKALRQTKLQYIAKKVPPKIWDSYVLMGF
jgi:tetratricopeptide (TPR) repeat protein